MKYLFLVQGEGRGHMTQAITLAGLLRRNGHEVVKVLIGKSERRVIPSFFFEKIQAPVDTYESPNFVVDKNQKGVKLPATIFYNVRRLPVFINSLQKIRKTFREYKPDAVINFYEILGGLYYMIYKPSVPHYCIGHQFLSFHPEFEFPKGKIYDKFSFLLANKIFSWRATKRFALSFRKMDDYLPKKVIVVPPLLRNEVLQAIPSKGNYILCYILNDGYRNEIEAWHAQNKEIPVHFFSDAKKDKDEEVIHENLIWHKINDVLFLEMMKNCMAFASTAGFESVCEAMYLGKPVLTVPTAGHYEQLTNAIDAAKTKRSIPGNSFNLTNLVEFIEKFDPDNTDFKNWVDSAEKSFLCHLTS